MRVRGSRELCPVCVRPFMQTFLAHLYEPTVQERTDRPVTVRPGTAVEPVLVPGLPPSGQTVGFWVCLWVCLLILGESICGPGFRGKVVSKLFR